MKPLNKDSLEYVKLTHIVKILEQCEWNRTNASKVLEITVRTLSNAINRAQDEYNVKIGKPRRGIKIPIVHNLFPTNKQRLTHMDRVSNMHSYY